MRERAKRLRKCKCYLKPMPPPESPVPCHWGNCTEFRCPACGKLRFSIGTPWCPCDGYIRWLRYPGMRNPYAHWDRVTEQVVTPRAAVKPSIARRRNQRKRKSA